MKRVLSALALSFLFQSIPAQAHQADHFKGAYEVLSQISSDGLEDKKYVICDVDTVAGIWAKYGNGELPTDLQPIKDQSSILVGFTFRNGIFFNLESNSFIGPNILAVAGPKTDRLQITRRADGTHELGVRIEEVLNFYNLGPRIPLGRIQGATKALRSTLQID